ncbi:MAG: hypothetical protein QY326_05175 [Bdellovibrionota bacterium]|nr:MAG: hypothetical protein QY326_05175 [Bdellovibrionota bacterium]
MNQYSAPKDPLSRSHVITVQHLSHKSSISDKPNEDALLVDLDNRIYALADGVSRLRGADGMYPNPSPASEVAQLLVTQASQFIADSVPPITVRLLEEALRVAGSSIANYNKEKFPNPDFGINDYAGAVGIVGSIGINTLRYAYIGDCVGLLVRGGAIRNLTVNQTEGIEAYIRTNKGTPNLEQTIRREIRNNESHPLSWGVLTGEDKSAAFIKSGELSLNKGDRVVFCSDGLLGVVSRYSALLAEGSANEIVNAMLKLEDDGSYRSDDKTLILIDIG